MSKIVQINQKIEDTVVDGYKNIEKTVVGGYQKIEDKFIDAFLKLEDETLIEAKERLKKEQQEINHHQK